EKNGDIGDAKVSVGKLMKLITIPVYPMYRFNMKKFSSIYDVMTERTLSVFELLSKDGRQKKFTYGLKYNSEGKKLFECLPNNRYKVYDQSGNVICNAIVGENGIVKGQAKIFNEEGILMFDGSFLDGKR